MRKKRYLRTSQGKIVTFSSRKSEYLYNVMRRRKLSELGDTLTQYIWNNLITHIPPKTLRMQKSKVN